MTKQDEKKETRLEGKSELKVVLKGEKCPRGVVDINSKEKTARIKHVTQIGSKESPIYVHLDHLVDLSKTDMETILQHAVADMVIKLRKKAFKDKSLEELKAEFERGFVFRPENYPSERSNGVSNEVKMGRQFEKSSRLEKIAFLISVGLGQKEAAEMVDSGNSF